MVSPWIVEYAYEFLSDKEPEKCPKCGGPLKNYKKEFYWCQKCLPGDPH